MHAVLINVQYVNNTNFWKVSYKGGSSRTLHIAPLYDCTVYMAPRVGAGA